MTAENGAKAPVVTLDGPGGSGKGTIAMRVAHKLDWHFLDSGALYRLVAVAAMAPPGVGMKLANTLMTKIVMTAAISRFITYTTSPGSLVLGYSVSR